MGATEKHEAAYHGTGYLSEDDVLRLRLLGVPVSRELRPGRCCARCKTPYNCGNEGCTCHQAKGAR